MHNFLQEGDDVKKCDNGVKNKWRWAWISESDGDIKRTEWCKKVDKPGVAYCVLCSKDIKYGSNGKKSLATHALDPNHLKAHNAAKISQALPGVSSSSAPISITDRVLEQKMILTAFIAEHSLPYSLAPPLIELSQKLASDKTALNKLKMSRFCAAYTSTHGTGEVFKTELMATLKESYFSLNVDEATDSNWDKIMNVLVRFYDDDRGEIVQEHLAAVKANIGTSKILFKGLEKILEDNDLPWSNVISILMDNCNTMRGKRGGVETLCREENNNLLDISGDTVHMLNTAAKLFCSAFDNYLENVCSDIYYDIEKSPKASELFAEIQSVLSSGKAKCIIRPISSRFLQMLTVAERINELYDALVIFYFGFLTVEEKSSKKEKLKALLEKHHAEDQLELVEAIHKVANSQKSKCNQDRKDRILLALFDDSLKFRAHLDLYRGILAKFKGIIKKFQSEKPLVHELHSELVAFVKTILAQFVQLEHIPDSYPDLATMEIDRSVEVRDRRLGVGEFCLRHLQEAKIQKKRWLSTFYGNVREGYEQCFKSLQKLPLQNTTLANMSALDPLKRKSESMIAGLEALGNVLPNVVSIDEQSTLKDEILTYSVSQDVDGLQSNYKFYKKEERRIDRDFWAHVFKMKQYPVLSRLVKALLSIFTAPLVESSFNLMDDIIEKDRSNLTVENYEATSRIKYALKRRNLKSTQLQASAKSRKICLHAYKKYLEEQKKKKAGQEAKQEERRLNNIKLAKNSKAKKAVRLEKLKSLARSKNSTKISKFLPKDPPISQRSDECMRSKKVCASMPHPIPLSAKLKKYTIPKKRLKVK